MSSATAALQGRQFYVDIAGFYNHYGDLFSEDLLGAPYVENQPASHSRSDTGAIRKWAGGQHHRGGSRT